VEGEQRCGRSESGVQRGTMQRTYGGLTVVCVCIEDQTVDQTGLPYARVADENHLGVISRHQESNPLWSAVCSEGCYSDSRTEMLPSMPGRRHMRDDGGRISCSRACFEEKQRISISKPS
jgi:hypothetical protein